MSDVAAVYTPLRSSPKNSERRNMWTTTVLCMTALAAVISAQPPPECSDLGFGGRAERFRGADLPVCRSEGDQCCSVDYVEGVQGKVRERLERFLRREFEDVIEEYQDEVDNLLEYFARYFPQKLLQNFPLFEGFAENPIVRPILRNLVENFEIDEDEDDFDVGDFLERLVRSLARVGAGFIGRNEDTIECVTEVLESLVDEDAVERLRTLLQRIRRGLTALMRIGRFLERQRNRLEGARVLERCVSRFTELAFCSRCTRKTPPLCFGTCNALVRGCYSPYYSVLNGQYRRLWSKVQGIVELLNATVERVGETELIDFDQVVSEVREQCRVTVRDNDRRERQDRNGDSSTPRHKSAMDSHSDTGTSGSGSGEEEDTSRPKSKSRGTTGRSTSGGTTGRSTSRGTTGDSTGDSSSSSSSDALDGAGDVEFIPLALVDDVFQLNGAFQYGRRRKGLRFCSDALYDDSDESCPPEQAEDKFCKGSDVCTSKCRCTDGMKVTRDNETDLVYDGSDVEDQDGNPVLGISQGELRDEANRIAGMGDPVASFLASDEFRSVDPSVDEQKAVESEGEEEGGSAAGLGASLSALLLAVMATLLS